MHPLHTSYALTAWPRDSHLAHLGYPRARKYLDRTSEALQSIQSHCRIVASFGAMCDNNVTVLQPGHSVTYLSQYHSVSVMISYDTISHSHLHPLSRIILMCNNLGTHREQPCSYFVLQPWNKPETVFWISTIITIDTPSKTWYTNGIPKGVLCWQATSTLVMRNLNL